LRHRQRPTRARPMLSALFLGLPIATRGTFLATPLEHFEEDGIGDGARHFSHKEHHMLDDGSDFSLRWRAKADPDSILSLDVEHGSDIIPVTGVKLLECRPKYLILHVPTAHASRVQSWKHVVASRLVHGCEHLEEHPLYHRVIQAERTAHPEHGEAILLHTQELYSVSHVLPHLDYTYHVRPIASMPEDEQEARKEFMATRSHGHLHMSARRLAFDKWKTALKSSVGIQKMKKWWKASAHFEKPNMHSNFLPIKGGPSNIHDLLNFTPLRDASFGWNWDFRLDAVRSPNFRYHFPGGKGYIAFRDPYLNVHAGIKIHFKSSLDLDNLEVAPHVVVDANIYGNAKFNLDFATLANVKEDVNMKDEAEQLLKQSAQGIGKMEKGLSKLPGTLIHKVKKYHIPLLKNFTQDTYYFKPVEFYVASIPVRLAPGIRIGLDAFHLGRMKGSLRVGVNTKLFVNGSINFDSDTGITANFTCEAIKVKIQPPTWLIFTRHFEMGAALKPSFWLRGGIGPTKNMEIQAELIPYFNVSVLQHGSQAFGPQHLVTEKQLIIYPFRAIGLKPGTEWAVRIYAHGQTRTTSIQASSGVIEFNDHVQTFHFGRIAQNALIEAPITVQLLRDGVTPAGKPFKLFCESVLNGECHPSPSEASFQIDGVPVILQLNTAWHDNPTQFLLRKVRSFGLIFPKLNLTSAFGEKTMKKRPSKATFRFVRNGRHYDSDMVLSQTNSGNFGPASMTLDAETIFELGAVFVDTWHLNMGSYTNQVALVEAARPHLQLLFTYADGKTEVVGHGQLPGIPWDKDVRGQYGVPYQGMLPMAIQMKNISDEPGEPGQVIATGVAGLHIQSAFKAAYWIRPSMALKFPQGSKQDLHWTIEAAENIPIDFIFRAFKVDANDHYSTTTMVHKLAQKVCVQNEAIIRRYGDYGQPCVFSEILEVQKGLVGSRIAFQIEWNTSGIAHKVLSAPVTFVSEDPLRRLADETFTAQAPNEEQHTVTDTQKPDEGRVVYETLAGQDMAVPMQAIDVEVLEATGTSRRLQVSDKSVADTDFNAKMAEMQHQDCSREPLEYSIGVGLYFRAKVHNLHLPGVGFQGINLPNWDSQLMPIQSTSFGKKLSDVLPKSLCDGGICDGTLPGCSPHTVDPTIIPKVEFQLSRNFHWNPSTSQFTKDTIAYGMAMAPGLLELTAMSFKKLLQTTTSTTQTVTEADMFWAGSGDDTGKECTWVPKRECVSAFQYEGIAYFGCTRSGSKSGWCSMDTNYRGNWRPCKKECRRSWVAKADPFHSPKVDPFHSPKFIATNSNKCFWQRAPGCVPKFQYKGFNYFGCVTNPHDQSKAWCSDDSVFMGNWHHCQWSCPHAMKPQITQPPVATSKAQTEAPLASTTRAIKTTIAKKPTTTLEPSPKKRTCATFDCSELALRHFTHTPPKHLQCDVEGCNAATCCFPPTTTHGTTTPEVTTTPKESTCEAFNCKHSLTSRLQAKNLLCDPAGCNAATCCLQPTTTSTVPMSGESMAPKETTCKAFNCEQPLTLRLHPKNLLCDPMGCNSATCCSKTTCEAFSCEHPLTLRLQPETITCTDASGCDAGTCCMTPKSTSTRHGDRRLENTETQETHATLEEDHESSRFFVHFNPDGVVYKIDENLMDSLIKRGAFNGLKDGREHELGEARITGFKIHHGGAETKAEAPLRWTPPTALMVTSAAAFFLMGLLAVRFTLKFRTGSVKYEQVDSGAASTAA